ncbi:hypothetical protein ACKVEX_03610 [Rhodocyclaceae bacterium SMB388]
MIIASSEIQMQSSHLSFSRTEVSERLEMWFGERPGGNRSDGPQASPSARVTISPEALAESATGTVTDEVDPLDTDPHLRLMATMIAMLTGRPVRLLRLDDRADPTLPADGQPAAARDTRRGPGFSIEYELSATRIEFEQTTFQASGVVRTDDGREIRFDVGFMMARSYMESVNVSFRAGEARLKDPLVLDFGGPAASLQDTRFAFDLDADGELDRIPLLGGGRGFLAFDRNDDGRELFGPTTGNGFAELSALDSDGNGWIDEADPAYTQLRLWRPSADGQGVLQTLSEAGVGALYLGRVATPFDLRNPANQALGVMRSSGVYVGQDGRVGTVRQIDLSV